jgi:hypothetical protein
MIKFKKRPSQTFHFKWSKPVTQETYNRPSSCKRTIDRQLWTSRKDKIKINVTVKNREKMLDELTIQGGWGKLLSIAAVEPFLNSKHVNKKMAEREKKK